MNVETEAQSSIFVVDSRNSLLQATSMEGQSTRQRKLIASGKLRKVVLMTSVILIMLIAGCIFVYTIVMPTAFISSLDGGMWSSIAKGINVNARAIVVYKGDLVFAGLDHESPWISDVYRVNGGSWERLGNGTGIHVTVLAVFDDKLIAASSLFRPGQHVVKAWDGRKWSELTSQIYNPRVVQALTVFEGELIAGSEDGVHAFDGKSWKHFGQVTKGLAKINVLAVYHDNLIVGGDFTEFSGVQARNIVMWNGKSWAPLGPGVESEPRSITADHSTLYVGGGEWWKVAWISAWNGEEWIALGSGTMESLSSLSIFNNRLIATGYSNDDRSCQFTMWDGNSWNTFAPNLQTGVADLCVYNGRLIVAGTSLF